MNKLEVGQFVRTKKGIGKIDKTRIFMKRYFEIHLDSNKGKIHNVNDNTYWNNIEDIIKASHNIIDLIGNKDVVRCIYDNEEFVAEVELCGDTRMLKVKANLRVSIGCVEIKSILTKEQFESMEYRIGD